MSGRDSQVVVGRPVARLRLWTIAVTAAIALGLITGCEDKPKAPTDPREIEALPWIAKLEKGDPPDRERAIAALAAIDHPCVVAPLLHIGYYDIQVYLRGRAIRALARPQILSEKDIQTMISLLRSSEEDEVRLALCETLGRLKASAAEGVLADSIGDRATFVRLAALKALSQIGPSGLARLERMFSEGSVEERIAIIDVFGRGGDASRVPALLATLADDEDQIRMRGAEAVGRLRDERAVAPLMQLVRQPLSERRLAEYERRLTAKPSRTDLDRMYAMLDEDVIRDGRRPTAGMHNWIYKNGPGEGLLRRHINQQRRDAARAIRRVAIDALREIGGEKASASLVGLLADEDPETGEAVKAALADEKATPEATTQTANLLHGIIQDRRIPTTARVRAVELLIREGKEAAVNRSDKTLLEAIRLADAGQAKVIPQKKHGVAPPDPVVPLDDRLRDALVTQLQDKDPAFVAFCARTLAMRKVEAALEPATALLGHPDPAIKAVAVEAVGQFGGPATGKAVPGLLRLLKPPTTNEADKLQKAAVTALGAIRQKEAVPGLLPIATTIDHPLAVEAVRALGQIGDPAAGKPLLEFYRTLENRPSTKPANDKQREAAIERERRAGALRGALVTALGQVKCAEAVPTLIELVKTGSVRGGLGPVAMTALAEIGDRSAVPVICHILRNGPYSYHARTGTNHTSREGAAALVKLGDPAAVEALIHLGHNPPDEMSRDCAFKALGELKCPQSTAVLIAALVDPKVDPAIKDANVGPALAEQGMAAKDGLLKLVTDTPMSAEGATFDAGIYAAQILAVIGADIVPDLAKLTTGKPKHVIARVIEALQRIDDDQAVAALAVPLKHPDSEVRQWSAVAMGKLKRKVAIPLLEEARKDQDPKVVEWVEWAMKQM